MTRIRTLVVAFVATFAVATPARAGFFVTGDPVADSVSGNPDTWLFVGNSLQAGKYIRGDGNFSFDMYRTRFSVFQSSGLEAATEWGTSDQIIAMGGVIVSTSPSGLTGDIVNSNLTDSLRIVSKFTNTFDPTVSPKLFTPSTVAPDQGNGQGSFSTGDGGPGSVLIATDLGQVVNAAHKTGTKPGQGVLTPAGVNEYWNGTTVITLPDDKNARFIYKYSELTQKLTSWEVLLNTTRLGVEVSRQSGNPNTVVPDWNGHWNQSLQRGVNDFTDAINQHAPLPPTLVALAAGAGLLGLGRRLRRGA